MKFKLAFSFAFLLNFSCFSQDTTNLVPNWSFEDSIECPTTQLINDNCKYWFTANTANPTRYSECAPNSLFDVPNNSVGYQNAFNGDSYAGLDLISGGNTREYIEVRLNSLLMPNKTYCFELRYSLSDISMTATPKIQVYLTEDSVFQSDIYYLPYSPQITNLNSNITDTLEWQKMEGSYIATGNEKFIIIGNFASSTQDSDTALTGWGTWGGSHYLIDAIRLYDCTPPDTTVYSISVFPNPNNGAFTVNYNLGENVNSGSFKIYDAIGKLVYNEKLTQNNGTLNLDLFLATGVYFWEIRDEENNLLRSDKIVFVD